MTLRGRAGLWTIVCACVLAFADAAIRERSPLVAGIRASMFGCAMVLAPLSLVFVAGSARRDDAAGASDVVDSRPYPAHLLFLARFLGNYAVALFAYVLVIVCSLAAPLVLGGGLSPSAPLIAWHAFVRGIVPLLVIATLGYCGVSLARNVLAAALVAVYWLFILLWGDFLARIFNFSLTQNWPTYTALSVGILLGTMAIRRRYDVDARLGLSGRLLPLAAAALLVFGLLNAWQRVASGHDRPLRQDPFALQLASQYIEASPKAPGLWLPDQRGELWRISSAEGKVLVIAFWSPHVADSVTVLDSLREVLDQAPEGDVACVAVCIADDHAISPHIAREGRYRFPMVTDTGAHFDPKLKECAPLSEAYELGHVPAVFITDRGRRIIESSSRSAGDTNAIIATVNRALTLPVPPGVGVERS